ncbi:Isochorismatase hydrolase [Trametopsis cervina]|nr:Isochorismatase hydrolase [Trametopsis cervina]
MTSPATTRERPHVAAATEYGNAASFWVEYPSGLVDLTSTSHLPADSAPPPLATHTQFEIGVEQSRVLRLNRATTALVVIDMQNFFLHPDLREHTSGLACVAPLTDTVHALRKLGGRIIWCNWGLTPHELTTIPPSLSRGFSKNGRGGFGSALPEPFGALLMRDTFNAALYGPLQPLFEEGREKGTDVWIHKNRMSGLWGPQTALDLYLQEQGITTLLFAGVNADQCVLGTLVDAYFRGYTNIVLRDCIATTSPAGAYENVLYNTVNSYGFVTDSKSVVQALETDEADAKLQGKTFYDTLRGLMQKA